MSSVLSAASPASKAPALAETEWGMLEREGVPALQGLPLTIREETVSAHRRVGVPSEHHIRL